MILYPFSKTQPVIGNVLHPHSRSLLRSLQLPDLPRPTHHRRHLQHPALRVVREGLQPGPQGAARLSDDTSQYIVISKTKRRERYQLGVGIRVEATF
jgi:hypothetical protein